MKVIILIGKQNNHMILCHKLKQKINVEAVVVINKSTANKNSVLVRLLNRILSFPLSKAWQSMQNHYRKQLQANALDNALYVDDVNSGDVLNMVKRINPDLVIVSGTNLLGKELIRTILKTGRIMNLHTGISPYVNGGPNCTNWCLANKKFSYIGNTVMWLNEGIDSGNLILTERTKLLGNESLSALHVKVMEHAHEIYQQCIVRYLSKQSLPNVEQNSIAKGEMYYTKNWSAIKSFQAFINFCFYFNEKSLTANADEIRLVSFNEDNS